MAFDFTSDAGTWAASFVAPLGGTVVQNADGSYTAPIEATGTLSGSPAGSLQDANTTGFPNVISPHNLGLPGLPGQNFVSGEIPGILITNYNVAKAPGIVEVQEYNYDGTVSSVFSGFDVVGYNANGFLMELIPAFSPLNQSQGTYVGTVSPLGFEFVSFNASLNTFDAAGNQIASGLSFPQTLLPTVPASAPEPAAVGIVALLALLAVVGLRSMSRGRATAV